MKRTRVLLVCIYEIHCGYIVWIITIAPTLPPKEENAEIGGNFVFSKTRWNQTKLQATHLAGVLGNP